MMRENPLPIGDYWVDVFAKDWTKFGAWLSAHEDTVQVMSTESTWANNSDPPIDAQGGMARNCYVFHVSAPTKWEGPGFPHIGAEVIMNAVGADIPEPSKIQLVEGEQVWWLYATDKFGLSAEDLITDGVHGLGVALRAILSQAKGQSGDLSPWQEFRTGSNEYRLGNARPIQIVSVGKAIPSLPAGKVLADRNTYPGDGIPTVVGQQVWNVVIRFWWRAPNEALPWPAFTSLFPALPDLKNVNGAEWVLAKAIVPTQTAKDPGDASWGSAQEKRIEEAASKAAGAVGGTLAKVGMGIALVAALGIAGYLAVSSFAKSRSQGG